MTNFRARENQSKVINIALDVMRKTPHTRLNTSASEMHNGRESNTEISSKLNHDKLEAITKSFISATPITLQVYSLHGADSASDQLPMKQKKER